MNAHRQQPRHPLSPPVFPFEWASDYGEDQYGLWVAFIYKNVRQCFRWVEPGAFLMGSPEGEKGRYQDEQQHLVTLSKGFWIAETACIQALWETVTGDNPSAFKGAKRPVVNVRWEDVQTFIETLNDSKPNLALRLPTEAEWEYSCRAKTSTAYVFGDSVDHKQAQYRAEETVPVKSFQCNAWGLYDMHGNVWEWCEDWFGEYPGEVGMDPIGSAQGDHRVVRGGSWFSFAQTVRSACRSKLSPEDRNDDIGFRLVHG